MENTTIFSLSEIKTNNRLNLGNNRSSNISATDSVSNSVKESIDDSCYMKVTLKLVWKNISVLSFDDQNSCFSTLFLQLFKLTKNRISDFYVHNRFRCFDSDTSVFDTCMTGCCCNDSVINCGCSIAGFKFANDSNICSWGDEARRHIFNSLHNPWMTRCLVLF